MADEFFLIGQTGPFGGRATGDDEGFGFDPLAVNFEAVMIFSRLEFFERAELEACAEFFGLRLHAHDEVGAIDAFGEAREIFHRGGGGELAAGLQSLQDKRG